MLFVDKSGITMSLAIKKCTSYMLFRMKGTLLIEKLEGECAKDEFHQETTVVAEGEKEAHLGP